MENLWAPTFAGTTGLCAERSFAELASLGRIAYIHVIRSALLIKGNTYDIVDAARIADEDGVTLTATRPAPSSCFFDLPS